MSNQNTKPFIYREDEPTYKIIGQDKDNTYIQKETRYTYGSNINMNSYNLSILLLMFNEMCPKKYRTIEAAQIFLEKDNQFNIYKCWVDDERTGEPFIIDIFNPVLKEKLYFMVNTPENFTEDIKVVLHHLINKIYRVNICMVCDTKCNKKCLCGMVYYCCEEHQKQDRKIHKRICQASKIDRL